MTREDLQTLVTDGETVDVEFKKSTGQRTEATKTICAMLNGQGGSVLFGVTSRNNITGQDVSQRTLEQVIQELKHIEPYTSLEPEVVLLDNMRSVIVISMTPGDDKPYTYKNKPYMRQGPTTSAMPQAQYRRLLREQMHATQRWELMPAYQFGMDDLDHAEITRTVEEAIRRRRMEEPGTRDPEALLLGLGLIVKGKLINAAVALFGNSNRLLPYYAQCLLRLARFRGTTKSVFEDNREINGNAFEIFLEAQRFLRQHLPIASRIVPGLFERIDEPLYPPEALREALVNAICHRDYASRAGSIGVAIYDDRLEISSIGPLPFGQTVADLTGSHRSQPWNPLIARVFHRRGLIEKWGRGTLKMAELTEKAGLPPPEFEEQAGSVIVRFRPTSYVPPSRISHDLSPLQYELLEILSAHGAIAISEMVDMLQTPVARRTVQENMAFLQRLGLAEVTGRGRGARWRMVNRRKPQ